MTSNVLPSTDAQKPQTSAASTSDSAIALEGLIAVTAKELIIEKLNVSPPSREDQRAALERYGTRRGSIPMEEFRPFFPAYLSQRLRACVDDWLDTGRRPDGSEEPFNRTLPLQLLWKVREYIEEHKHDVGRSIDNRGIEIVIDLPTYNPADLLFKVVEDDAIRLFCAIIVSRSWRSQVCKCRYTPCGRYFLLHKPRRWYKHGTFCCIQHQSHQSAVRLTKARRSEVTRRLIAFAATFVGSSGPEWADDLDMKRRLAAALSDYISSDPNLQAGRQHVKVNWVTRHRSEIETARITMRG